MASERTPGSSKDGHGPGSNSSPGGYRAARFVDSAGSEAFAGALPLGEDSRARLSPSRQGRGNQGDAMLPWASLEEEATHRWSRALQLSPKATSENLNRRGRDDGVRRELELLEEKLMRQVLRLQEQSERFMDIMMHPLEAKVAVLEGRQPVTDCSIAELRGNLKGLQESLEMQVRRADQAETRWVKWRKSVEEELQSRQEDIRRKLAEDVVTRGELLELATVLKQELRKVVDETIKDGHMASQQDLVTLATCLRKELESVEKIAAGAAAAKALGQQELAHAAEAVRAEMKALTERAVQDEAMATERFSALDTLEKAAADLSERLGARERSEEEIRNELHSHRELLESYEAADHEKMFETLGGRMAKMEEFMEEMQRELHESLEAREPFKEVSEALEESHLSKRLSKLEQEQMQKSRQLASSIEALEVAVHEGLAKNELQAAMASQRTPTAERETSVQILDLDEEVAQEPLNSDLFALMSSRLAKCERLAQAGEKSQKVMEATLSQRLAACEHSAQAAESSKDALESALDAALAKCEKLAQASQSNLESSLSERIATCEESTKELASHVSDQLAHLAKAAETSLQAAEEGLARQLSAQEGAVQALEARLQHCERRAEAEAGEASQILESVASQRLASVGPISQEAQQAVLEMLPQRLRKCEEALEQLPERLATFEQMSQEFQQTVRQLPAELEASQKQFRSLAERLASCEEALAVELRSSGAELAARPPTDRLERPNLPGQAHVDRPQGVEEVKSRLDLVEVQQRAGEASLASSKRFQEELSASIQQRLEKLEAQPAKAAMPDEQELSDTQLMLLDLQRRVCHMEQSVPTGAGVLQEGEEATAILATPRAALSHAAQLIENIELDLQKARQAAGVDSARSRRSDSDLKESTPRALPPLAAMKVAASPRLLQLALTPRAQLPEQPDPAAMCTSSQALSQALSNFAPEGKVDSMGSELRAEVAAVWDAVAELAEIVGDAAPPGAVRLTANSNSGAIQQMAGQAVLGVESCERRLDVVKQEITELKVRIAGIEQVLPAVDDTLATFDARGNRMFRPDTGELAC